MNESAAPSRRIDRFDWLTLGALVVMGAAFLFQMSSRPSIVGKWEDDAVYLATAKAIADGHGYRHIELPGEPWQTKYPPAYPAVLAVLWKCFPNLVDKPLPLQTVNVVMLVGAHWLTYRMMRRSMGVSWLAAGAGVVASMSSHMWFELSATSMSECMFTLLAMGGLGAAAACERRGGAGTGGGSITRIALVAGALIGAALLTRSVGVGVAAGVVGILLLRRRWKASILVGLPIAACFLAWFLWRAHASGLNAAIPTATALSYELDYSSWVISSPLELGRVAALNAAEAAYGGLFLLRPLPWSWIDWCLGGGVLTLAVLWAGVAGLMWLMFLGAERVWRSGQRAALAGLALYLAMVLVWPFQPVRLILPLLPVASVLVFWGAAGMVRGTGIAHGRLRAGLLLAMLALACLPGPEQQLGSFWKPADPVGTNELLSRSTEMIKKETPPEAVVAVVGGGVQYLRTGRKCVLPFPSTDPVTQHCPPDRSILLMGLGQTPMQEKFPYSQLAQLPAYLTGVGATYEVIVEDGSEFADAFTQFRNQHVELFRDISSEGYLRIVRVRSGR